MSNLQQTNNQQALHSCLKQVFGYDSFRPYQAEVINHILNQQDVMAVLPTGAGKSLCFQLPAMLCEGVVVVISPLIALMQDQVDSLRALGIQAAYINSSLSPHAMDDILADLNQYQLIYIAPERLAQPYFMRCLKQAQISFFVIDEAHCISQWGHDFRPDYRQLTQLKAQFPDKAIAAFTATATQTVNHDICQQLAMVDPQVIQSSFDRPNLLIRIVEKAQTRQQVVAYLAKHPQESGVIYVATRKKVDNLHAYLAQQGHSVVKYHAGLTDTDRMRAQRAFINDDAQIIVATVAFGMGIHKSNIRFVIHTDMPKNMEQYYQEIGRAGRDGLPSSCYLLHGMQDVILQKRMSDQHSDPQVRAHMQQKSEQMFDFCMSLKCRRVDLLAYFSEDYGKTQCGACDNCLSESNVMDGTVIAQKVLSCVYRLQQRFGLKYCVDVLRGSQSKTVLARGHDQLSTYGLLADCGQKEVQYYVFSLVNQGYLQFSQGEYPVLQLTPTSRAVLKGEQIVQFREKKHSEKKAKIRSDMNQDYDKDLFESLRALRKQWADEAGIPPFVIFHDRTLVDICIQQPTTEAALLQINGIGEKKLAQYGQPLLDFLQAEITPA